MSMTKKIDKYMGMEKNANVAYKKRYKSIMKSLDKLKQILKKHSMKQDKNPTDWGYAGDLSYIDDEITELMSSFKNFSNMEN